MKYLKILTVVFLMALLQSVNAQVVIKENIELNTEQMDRKAKTADELGFSETMFIADTSGSLRFYLDDFAKYRHPLSGDNKLVIRIKNGSKDTTTIIEITPDLYSEPIITPLEGFCGEPFYLYGDGMFLYSISKLPTSTTEDTYVNIDAAEINFGNSPIMEIKKDESISLIKFDLPVIADSAIVESSSLSFGASRVGVSASNIYKIGRVTSAWSENNVTWLTRPSVTSFIPFTVGSSSSSGLFRPDITQLASDWLYLKQENYGLALELATSDRGSSNILFNTTENDFIPPGFNVAFSVPSKTPVDTLHAGSVATGDTVYVRYQNNSDQEVEISDIELTPFILEFFEEFISRPEDLDRLYFGSQRFDFNLPCQPQGNRIETFQFYSAIVADSSNLELNLEIPAPKEVWPTIPETGANNNFDFNTVENVMQNIIIEVKEDDLPKEAQNVTITTAWIERSGGHNHNGGNDILMLPDDRMGWIINPQENDSSHTELAAVTNVQGEIELNFRAPQFGGKIEIEAWTVQAIGDTLFATDTITVKVPDLVLLPDGENYEKVGGTPSHHGPRVDNMHTQSRTPDNNHYATEAFRDSLISIANAWADSVANDSTLDNRQTPLNINDLSLPNGGKMDVFGSWNAPHATHRVGRDADIRTTRSLPIGRNRNGVLLSRVVIAGEEQFINTDFENLCIEKGANPAPGVHFSIEDGQRVGEHYHVYFY